MEIHFEKSPSKVPECRAQSGPIYDLSALQYSTVQYSTAQYMACLPCSTNNIFHVLSVIPRFIKRGHNNNCDVMYHQRDVSWCPAQCHGMQMLEGAASSLQQAGRGIEKCES